MGSVSISNSMPITRLPLLTSLSQCLLPTSSSFSPLPPLSNRRRSNVSQRITASAVFSAPAGVNDSLPVSTYPLSCQKNWNLSVWWCEIRLGGFRQETRVTQLVISWQGDSICMLLSPQHRSMMVIMLKPFLLITTIKVSKSVFLAIS